MTLGTRRRWTYNAVIGVVSVLVSVTEVSVPKVSVPKVSVAEVSVVLASVGGIVVEGELSLITWAYVPSTLASISKVRTIDFMAVDCWGRAVGMMGGDRNLRS